MSTVYKFRVYSPSNQEYHHIWAESEPEHGPNGVDHIIDPTLTTIVDKIETNVVKIFEEHVPTQGYHQTSTMVLTAAPNAITEQTITFDYRITVFIVSFNTKDHHEGDTLEIEINPEGRIGIITSDVAVGDTLIHVSPTVIEHSFIGMYVSLDNNSVNDIVGEVIAIDKVNNTIRLKTGANHSFSASTPTFVESTVKYVKNYTIGPQGKYEFGKEKIGGASIPPNVPLKIIYNNKTNETKKLYLQYDYNY